MSTTPQKPTVGRIILVPVQTRRSHGDGEGLKDATVEIRPAIVVRVNSTDPLYGTINVKIFSDGSNDNLASEWGTSLRYSQEEHVVGTWHWMPYQMAVAAGAIPAVKHEPTPV